MYAFRSAHAAREHVRSRGGDGPGDAAPKDEAARETAAARRHSVRASLSEPELRRQVQRDLEALMNAVAMESSLDLSAFPAVRRSVLNFGCPDISTRTIDEARLEEVRAEIAAAVRCYEPRLIRDTVKVTRERVEDDDLKLRYVVRADLACVPFAVPVQFVADVELDSGVVKLARL
jgi:type VI secretion system protein ImpF